MSRLVEQLKEAKSLQSRGLTSGKLGLDGFGSGIYMTTREFKKELRGACALCIAGALLVVADSDIVSYEAMDTDPVFKFFAEHLPASIKTNYNKAMEYKFPSVYERIWTWSDSHNLPDVLAKFDTVIAAAEALPILA